MRDVRVARFIRHHRRLEWTESMERPESAEVVVAVAPSAVAWWAAVAAAAGGSSPSPS